jgi:thiamine biosynthesis protein ThiS
MIALTVNGAPRTVTGGTTVAGLLSGLGLDPRMVVVERNGTILRQRDEFRHLALEAGDVLELVHFVGGG